MTLPYLAKIGTSPAGKRIDAIGYAYQAEQERVVVAAQEAAVAAAKMEHDQRSKDLNDGTWARVVRAEWATLQPEVVVTTEPPLWRQIIHEVCAQHGVTADMILSPCRKRSITTARFEVYYRLYTETTLSMTNIGHKLNRDHSSLLHGIRVHAARHGLPVA